MKDFFYRLLFTRDDDLDVLQLVFLAQVFWVNWCAYKVFSGQWKPDTGAWAMMGSVFATLAIVGVPKWAAELVARRQQTAFLSGSMPGPEWEQLFTGRVDDPDDT